MQQEVASAPTQVRFEKLMRDVAGSGSLARMLAVLVVAEWSYMSWGERVRAAAVPEPFWCREWVDLHSGDYFGSVVAYLRGLDRLNVWLNENEYEEITEIRTPKAGKGDHEQAGERDERNGMRSKFRHSYHRDRV